MPVYAEWRHEGPAGLRLSALQLGGMATGVGTEAFPLPSWPHWLSPADTCPPDEDLQSIGSTMAGSQGDFPAPAMAGQGGSALLERSAAVLAAAFAPWETNPWHKGHGQPLSLAHNRLGRGQAAQQ